MYIHWKSLFYLGALLWLLLCITDLLGDPRKKYFNRPYTIEEVLQDDLLDSYVEKKLRSQMKFIEKNSLKFGWNLVVWNIVALLFSFAFCSLAKTVKWAVVRIYQYYRVPRSSEDIQASQSVRESLVVCHSKIPVLVSKSTTTMKSELDISQRVSNEGSCPNLLQKLNTSIPSFDLKKDKERMCQTIFKNKLLFGTGAFGAGSAFDAPLQNQCARLREEMLIVQATSLKEHAALSRKLEAVTREKRELSKQLAIAHKENRAAKQQLEELLEEKALLVKRLENATKEFKNNTKTKKVALAKLEEVSSNVEVLKQKLEQVTRDKEILENKLKLIEEEYEKLKERVRKNSNFSSSENRSEYSIPERDKSDDPPENSSKQTIPPQEETITRENRFESLLSSSTEIDMKKIQYKIMQLEKNLENFRPIQPNFKEKDNKSDIDNDNKESTDETVEPVGREESPPKFLTEAIITQRKKQYEQNAREACKVPSSTLKGRVSILEKIREKKETSAELYNTSTEPESSSDELMARKTARIFSNSAAFQNFLKNHTCSFSSSSKQHNRTV